jgi:hypothetical protein
MLYDKSTGLAHQRVTKPEGNMIVSGMSKQEDWTKPAAMAMPKGGLFKDKVEQGRYGPIFP